MMEDLPDYLDCPGPCIAMPSHDGGPRGLFTDRGRGIDIKELLTSLHLRPTRQRLALGELLLGQETGI